MDGDQRNATISVGDEDTPYTVKVLRDARIRNLAENSESMKKNNKIWYRCKQRLTMVRE